VKLISTKVAAERKRVSAQAIRGALKRGDIDGERVSARTLVIVDNERFEEWKPNAIRQAAGNSKKSG
jgi:hypothetical protein